MSFGFTVSLGHGLGDVGDVVCYDILCKALIHPVRYLCFGHQNIYLLLSVLCQVSTISRITLPLCSAVSRIILLLQSIQRYFVLLPYMSEIIILTYKIILLLIQC